MKKTLSAPVTTFVFKFFFSFIWIGGFGAGTIMLFLSGQDEKWGFLLAWLAGSFFIYNFCVKLKRVGIDEKFLYISNYIKTISVPLSDISEIRENLFINLHPIFIRFKYNTFFGQEIMFSPKGYYFFRQHPIVRELRALVQKIG